MGGHDFAVVLKTDAVLGRYLAAARNIKPGELLLRDDPIIMCPNAPTDNNTIVCFGCCGITAKSASLPCNKCGWPLCSTECEKIPDHANFECKIFATEQIKPSLPSPYCFIAPAEYVKILRCLLLRELGKEDPNQLDRWNMLMNFEAHLDLRKSIPKVLFMSKLIRNFIQDLCKLTQFDDTIIDFILGTIDVNAFKNITNPLFLNGKAVQSSIQKNATCLYSSGSMVAHGCKRNTQSLTLPSGELEMRAGDFIDVDVPLTHAYVDLMLGTPERRKLLKEQFYFDCTCSRCADKTECGTYFSALKCQQCSSGFLLMDDPLDSWPYWKCNNEQCTEIQPTEYETELIQEVRKEEKKILTSSGSKKNGAIIANWMELLEKYRTKFHDNHYIILHTQVHLVKVLSNVAKPTTEILAQIEGIVSKYKSLYNTFYINKGV